MDVFLPDHRDPLERLLMPRAFGEPVRLLVPDRTLAKHLDLVDLTG